MKDQCTERVIESLRGRVEKGVETYGVTVTDNPLALAEWLQHLQEELMDAAVYIERIKMELKK